MAVNAIAESGDVFRDLVHIFPGPVLELVNRMAGLFKQGLVDGSDDVGTAGRNCDQLAVLRAGDKQTIQIVVDIFRGQQGAQISSQGVEAGGGLFLDLGDDRQFFRYGTGSQFFGQFGIAALAEVFDLYRGAGFCFVLFAEFSSFFLPVHSAVVIIAPDTPEVNVDILVCRTGRAFVILGGSGHDR